MTIRESIERLETMCMSCGMRTNKKRLQPFDLCIDCLAEEAQAAANEQPSAPAGKLEPGE